jgi:hypothetical protein
MNKETLSKTVSDMLTTHDSQLKSLQETKSDAQTASRKEEIMCAIFYERGKKRGLLNLAEELELDLEF